MSEEDLQKQIDSLQYELSRMQEEIDEGETTIDELEDNIRQLKSQIKRSGSLLEDERVEAQRLKRELEKIRNQNVELSEGFTVPKSDYQTAMANVKRLTAIIENNRSEINNINLDRARIANEADSMRAAFRLLSGVQSGSARLPVDAIERERRRTRQLKTIIDSICASVDIESLREEWNEVELSDVTQAIVAKIAKLGLR